VAFMLFSFGASYEVRSTSVLRVGAMRLVIYPFCFQWRPGITEIGKQVPLNGLRQWSALKLLITGRIKIQYVGPQAFSLPISGFSTRPKPERQSNELVYDPEAGLGSISITASFVSHLCHLFEIYEK